MILFESDWDNYPTAIVHLNTSNKTFLETSMLLRDMGISNHAFMLALLDPTLDGVNPYDEKLSTDIIIRITNECKNNPWYFYREIAMVPPSGGADPIQFRANRANVALIWLFYNHVTTLLIQPRQTGKSVSTDILMTGLMAAGVLNTKFNLLTKDDSLRVSNVTRLKEIYAELPYYLQLKTRLDTNNTEKITINAIGNEYTTSVAQASIKAALKLGRGKTIAINQVDEISFVKNIDVTLPALLAASGAAVDNAIAANAPYGNIFTTTAGYLSDPSGEYVYNEIYSKAFPFTDKIYDSPNIEVLNDVILKNSSSSTPLVLLEFNHRQLGFTDAWLRTKIARAMAKGEAILADFLNRWILGGATSPIDKDLLTVIKNSVRADYHTAISEYGYVTRWYVNTTRVVNNKLLISLDTSDAVGRDDIAMTIRDVKTGEVVGIGEYNETNLITFSEWLSTLFDDMPNMIMIIERRSSGVAILDNLLRILPAKGMNPFAKLFNWVVDEMLEFPARYKEVENIRNLTPHSEILTKYRKYFGYATSGSGKNSRDNLYGDALLSSIKYTGNVVNDNKLYQQIAGLTVRNGRIDHKTGGKDDLVIAWMLGYWFLTKAKNRKYYGLSNNEVLSVVINNELTKDGKGEEVIKQREQLALKTRIDGYIETLKNTEDKFRSMILSNKIKMLYKNIDTKYVPTLDLEELLDNIMTAKKQKRRNY